MAAQKRETVFRVRAQKRLDQIPNAWWESIQQKAICGTPDILGCVNGYFVAIELKGRGIDKATKLQTVKLQRIATAGGYAFLVNPDNLDATIAKLMELALEGTHA